jgi:hypothetical protein
MVRGDDLPDQPAHGRERLRDKDGLLLRHEFL